MGGRSHRPHHRADDQGPPSPPAYQNNRTYYAAPVSGGIVSALPGVVSDQWSEPTYVGWSEPTYVGRPAAPRAPGSHRARASHRSYGGVSADAALSLITDSRRVAVGSLVSRITGFLRTLALGAVLGVGVGSIADPYNTANSLPTIIYELLLGGVLSSVFIPLLVEAQEHDPDRGVAYTQRLLSVATVALGAATLLAMAAAPALTWVYVGDTDKRHLTTTFALLLLPQILFYGLGAMFTAVLNTRDVFALPAWAPVLNNLITLGTLGLYVAIFGFHAPELTTVSGPEVLLLGLGTTVGIVGQALCLLPALRRVGFRWRWRFGAAPAHVARARRFRRLGGWVIVYVLAGQVGFALITRIANLHDGLSTFAYAVLLFQLPYGVLGVSILTALMPRLARAAALYDMSALRSHLRLGARLSVLALVPATAGMAALGPLITSIIFVGHTSLPQARAIGTVLACASFGLLPYALVMLQIRAFYALQDARTPALLNIVMAGVEIAIVLPAAVLLHGEHVIEALAAATSVSYVVGACVGHAALRERLGLLGFAEVIRLLARVSVASAVAGLVAYLIGDWMSHTVGGRSGAAAGLLLGAAAGAAVFGILARVLRIGGLAHILTTIRR